MPSRFHGPQLADNGLRCASGRYGLSARSGQPTAKQPERLARGSTDRRPRLSRLYGPCATNTRASGLSRRERFSSHLSRNAALAGLDPGPVRATARTTPVVLWRMLWSMAVSIVRTQSLVTEWLAAETLRRFVEHQDSASCLNIDPICLNVGHHVGERRQKIRADLAVVDPEQVSI